MNPANNGNKQKSNKETNEDKKKKHVTNETQTNKTEAKEKHVKPNENIINEDKQKAVAEAVKTLLISLAPENELQSIKEHLCAPQTQFIPAVNTVDTKLSQNPPKVEQCSDVKKDNSLTEKEPRKSATVNFAAEPKNNLQMKTSESPTLNKDVKMIIESLTDTKPLQTLEAKDKISKKPIDSPLTTTVENKNPKLVIENSKESDLKTQTAIPTLTTQTVTVPIVKLQPPTNRPLVIQWQDIKSKSDNLEESKRTADSKITAVSNVPKIAQSLKSLGKKSVTVKAKDQEMKNGESEGNESVIKGFSPSEVKAVKKIQMLLPVEFRKRRIKSANLMRTTRLKIITFDKTHFCTCVGIQQEIILIIFAIKMLFCGLIRQCPDYIFVSRNSCPIAEGYFFTNLVGGIVITLLLLCYTFHVVEAFDELQWLFIEYVFYGTLASLDFVIACFIFGYGGFFIIVGILGLMSSFILFMLSFIKWYKYTRGDIAQPRRDDPDGNIVRQYAPNIRFKGHYGNLVRMWTM